MSNREFEDLALLPSTGQLRQLDKLARRALELEQLVAEGEEMVASLKEELTGIKNRDLPLAMKSCNMQQFRTGDGGEIVIRDYVSGSLPKLSLIHI